MSLVWWRSPTGAQPLAPARAGKFGAVKSAPSQQVTSASTEIFSPLPLIGTAALFIGLVVWLARQNWHIDIFNFRTMAIMAMSISAASAITLLQRFATATERRRAYIAITFFMTSIMIIVFLILIPMVHASDANYQEVALLRMWGSYMVRTIFAILLAVSVVVEHSRKRDLNVNIGWFATVTCVLGLIAYGILAFVPTLPDGLHIDGVPHMEEFIPLTILVGSLLFALKRKDWRLSRFHYHVVLLLILLSIGEVALLLAEEPSHVAAMAGDILFLIGLGLPFFSIQTHMYRSYRFAEQYRLHENWMTRSATGTHGGQELSPVVFREIAQQLNEAIAVTDVSGRIIFCNGFLSKMTGRTESQLLNASPSSWQHSSVAADFYPRVFARILKDKVMYEGEVKNAYPNNPTKSYLASLRITPVLNEVGDISCCVLQQRNISVEQERAHLLRQMIDTMPLGVMLVDVPSMKISIINTEAEYLLSRSGFNVRNVRSFDDIAAQLQTMDHVRYAREQLPPYRTVAEQKPSEVKDVALFLDSGTSPVAVWKINSIPFFHEDGTMHSMLVSFQDISLHREFEHRMSDFISVASHQLRTPLTSIKWTLDLLKRKDSKMTAEETQLMFDTCYQASERMMLTIQQLLQVAELEEGNIAGVLKNVKQLDINTVIAESLKALKPLIDQKKINVKLSVLKTVPPMHYSPLTLSQIIHNLLENAVKYTPEGGEVDSILTVRDNMVEWTVHDSGIGIPPQQLGKLFQKFARGDNAQRINPDGTGLGLYIVKSTLDSCGGTIRIDSEEGKGTTVYVTLPMAQKSKDESN